MTAKRPSTRAAQKGATKSGANSPSPTARSRASGRKAGKATGPTTTKKKRQPGARRDLVVVKLGGSLAAGAPPVEWLDVLVDSPASVVVVPGGGPFADQVRDMQDNWDLTEPLAHRMAIAAMEQFGQVLASLRPGLQTAETRSGLSHVLQAGRTPVWMPSRMTLDAPDIPETWDVTSDSLALWLARLIGARATILVKSKEPPNRATKAVTLAKRKDALIDPAFPIFLEGASCQASCLGPSGLGALAEALASGGLPGTEILP